MNDCETLGELLTRRRQSSRAVTFIAGAREETTVPVAGLHDRALGVLRHFQERGVRAGDELIIFTQNNEQFVDAFWACILGGIVPVPIAVGISDDHRFKLLHVYRTLRAGWVYTELSLEKRLRQFVDTQGLGAESVALFDRLLVVDAIKDISKKGVIHEAAPTDTAFIQFSSGSTSTPKGVVLTHENVLTNCRAIVEAARFSDTDVGLSWMPLTHDMGLIAFHLAQLMADMHQYIMDTAVFVRRPLLWLEKAAEHQATVTCSPNFGYKHVLRLLESRGLEGEPDLSPIRIIFNGAEPISVRLCERFADTMSRFGLRPNAVLPVYGLAEASVGVSMPEPLSARRHVTLDRHALRVGEACVEVSPEAPGAAQFMCVGRPIPDCSVRLVDDAGTVLAEKCIGRIEIAGANVTSGYYGAPEMTRSVMSADGWLDTGDLGFLVEGDLYVTGRSKDIIFVNGENYYPHDLEGVIHELDGFELGKVVVAGAVSPAGEGDDLLVFLQHRGEPDALVPAALSVRRHLSQRTGLEIAHVIPIARVPKTTSGKVQRHVLASAYADGDYDAVVAKLEALQSDGLATGGDTRTDLEDALTTLCNEIVTDWEIGPDDNLFEIGIGSLALVQIHERIDELYPEQLDITELFDAPTIREIAATLDERLHAPDNTA